VNGALVWGSNQANGPLQNASDTDPEWKTSNFALMPEGTVNTLPVASLTASPNPALTGQTVTYDGSASGDAEGPIADFRWDLDGNGSFEVDSGANPVVARSYPTAGAVPVRLRVTDSGGDTSDAIVTETINAPARDVTPPLLTVSFRRVQRLARVRRRGVAGTAKCNEACRVTFRLRLSRRTARRLHLRSLTIGRRTMSLAANRRTAVRIKLTRRAKARLRTARRVPITLRATAVDSAGNRRVVTRRLSLKR
jgi:hypothetical protein